MIFGAIILALNAAAVAGTSWRLYRLFHGTDDLGMINRCLWLALISLGQIVFAGLSLGYSGFLMPTSFLAFHVVLYSIARRYSPKDEVADVPVKNWINQRWTTIQLLERICLGFVGLTTLLYLFTGTLGDRLVHDATTYRLSRVAHWLQEGSIRHFPTNELRQSYHPINADLVIMWFMAPFPRGYPLANLAQFIGGILTLVATFGFARMAQLRRETCLGALVLLFLMPCFVVQWSTCQSDLFTTGLLWSGLYFLFQSLRQCRFAIPAWLGIALAIGAKGTVFYLGIGLVVTGLIWLRMARPTVAVLKIQIAAAAIAMAVFAAPRYVENAIHYGNPFAPPEVFALNHGDTQKTEWLTKLELNTRSYLIQAIEPNSNPPVLRGLLENSWKGMIASLPEQDPYSNTHYPRREWLEYFGRAPDPGADTLSSGIIIPFLAVIGTMIVIVRLVRSGGESARLLASLAIIPLLFMLFFGLMFLWWPTSFRYFNLLLPPAAILAARLFESFRPTLQPVAWSAALVLALITVFNTYTKTVNAGRIQLRSDQSPVAYLDRLQAQREVIDKIIPAGARIGVYLDWNHPLTGLYRNPDNPQIRLIRLAELPRLPDREFLEANGLDAVVSKMVQIPAPSPGMRYEVASGYKPDQPVYLVHLPTTR
jgi:hypothetical protein